MKLQPIKLQIVRSVVSLSLLSCVALGEVAAPVATTKPYRTFLHIQRYSLNLNGNPSNPISNSKIEMTFPDKPAIELPGNGQYWTVGVGQVQEINRSFEVPAEWIKGNGFKFEIQMKRKGSKVKPCQFDVAELSEYNRSYVCQTDLDWQHNKKIPEQKLEQEAIQIRIFTDLNSPKKEVPQDAIALR